MFGCVSLAAARTSRWKRFTKFYDWHTHQGGGGAIDLVVHLSGCDPGRAISWLERELAGHAADPAVSTIRCPLSSTTLPEGSAQRTSRMLP